METNDGAGPSQKDYILQALLARAFIMLNTAARTSIVLLLSPLICGGVVVVFVGALCDFTASRLRGRIIQGSRQRVISS